MLKALENEKIVARFLLKNYKGKSNNINTFCFERIQPSLEITRVEFENILNKLSEKKLFQFVHFEFQYLQSNNRMLAHTVKPKNANLPMTIKNNDDINYLQNECFTILALHDFEKKIKSLLVETPPVNSIQIDERGNLYINDEETSIQFKGREHDVLYELSTKIGRTIREVEFIELGITSITPWITRIRKKLKLHDLVSIIQTSDSPKGLKNPGYYIKKCAIDIQIEKPDNSPEN